LKYTGHDGIRYERNPLVVGFKRSRRENDHVHAYCVLWDGILMKEKNNNNNRNNYKNTTRGGALVSEEKNLRRYNSIY